MKNLRNRLSFQAWKILSRVNFVFRFFPLTVAVVVRAVEKNDYFISIWLPMNELWLGISIWSLGSIFESIESEDNSQSFIRRSRWLVAAIVKFITKLIDSSEFIWLIACRICFSTNETVLSNDFECISGPDRGMKRRSGSPKPVGDHRE